MNQNSYAIYKVCVFYKQRNPAITFLISLIALAAVLAFAAHSA
jgi:hypothetical protein